MGKAVLHPYIFFTGSKCREAMEFYKEALGGELEIKLFGEMGEEDPAKKDKVMHANLTGGLVELMASDASTREKFEESCISLSITHDNEEELRTVFEKLSEGGSNIMPFKMEDWGDMFGSLTDKYNVDWLFSIPTAQ